ncbi:A24 family peptidase [Microbacterium sp. 1P10UB]|uniref:prepilin peptidase n=1 Tax=unclassified Microbacterium TaxID=2609290 RepID=UPI0039A17081
MSVPDVLAVVALVLAYGWLAAASVVLAVVDVRTHRLPDRIVLPCYAVGVVLFAIAAALTSDIGSLLRAVCAAAVLFAAFLLLRMVSPAGLGGGDVKLAGVLGLFLGRMGWEAVLTGVVAAFLLGGVCALILIALRRARRSTALPFGPFLLAGAWCGILTAVVTS